MGVSTPNKLLLFVVLSVLFAGCAGKSGKSALDPWEPNAADASRAGTELPQLQAGLAIYRSHCGGCHMLYPISSQPAQQWPHWVQEMTERAHLSSTQAQSLTTYLVTMASRNQESLSSPNHP